MVAVVGFVYAVRCQDRVKIGHSRRPIKRIEQINPWCPFPVEFIGIRPGSINDETAIHRELKEHRAHHEWFFYDAKEVQDFLATLEKYESKVVFLEKTTDSTARRKLLEVEGYSWRSIPNLSDCDLKAMIKGLAVPNQETALMFQEKFGIPVTEWPLADFDGESQVA